MDEALLAAFEAGHAGTAGAVESRRSARKQKALDMHKEGVDTDDDASSAADPEYVVPKRPRGHSRKGDDEAEASSATDPDYVNEADDTTNTAFAASRSEDRPRKRKCPESAPAEVREQAPAELPELLAARPSFRPAAVVRASAEAGDAVDRGYVERYGGLACGGRQGKRGRPSESYQWVGVDAMNAYFTSAQRSAGVFSIVRLDSKNEKLRAMISMGFSEKMKLKSEESKAVAAEAQGWRLHLSLRSKTGYLAVSQEDEQPLAFVAKTPVRDGQPPRVIGRFATAVEAAVAVAKVVAGHDPVPEAKRGMRNGSSEAKATVTEAHGWKLHLSPASSTGYLSVYRQKCIIRPFVARTPNRKGQTPKDIGSFATAVEAAVAVAKHLTGHVSEEETNETGSTLRRGKKALREPKAPNLAPAGDKHDPAHPLRGGGERKRAFAPRPSRKKHTADGCGKETTAAEQRRADIRNVAARTESVQASPPAAEGISSSAAAADAPSTVDFTSAQVAMEAAEGVGRRDEAVREGGSADHVI